MRAIKYEIQFTISMQIEWRLLKTVLTSTYFNKKKPLLALYKYYTCFQMESSRKSINFVILLLCAIIIEVRKSADSEMCAKALPFPFPFPLTSLSTLWWWSLFRSNWESAYKASLVALYPVNYFRWGCKFYLLYYAWSVLLMQRWEMVGKTEGNTDRKTAAMKYAFTLLTFWYKLYLIEINSFTQFL